MTASTSVQTESYEKDWREVLEAAKKDKNENIEGVWRDLTAEIETLRTRKQHYINN